MRLFKNSNVPFVQLRKIFFAISIILMVASITGIVIKNLNWSTDFNGGVTVIVNMLPKDAGVKALDIEDLRKVINDGGFEEAHVQFMGDRRDATFQISGRRQRQYAQR